MKPKISIIIATRNVEKIIGNCLDSVLNQTYKDFEVLCADGFSTDKTVDIIKKYSNKDNRIKLVISDKDFPEGKGSKKWEAYKKAKGEIVGFIDSDNLLQDKNFFKVAAHIFDNERDVVGVLGGNTHDIKDKKTIRYVALFGTDSFFAYRSIDFIRNIKNTEIKRINGSEVEIFSIEENNMPLTGGNCFFYLKNDLDIAGGYEQDILSVRNLLRIGKNKIFVFRNATKHYAEKSLFRLAKKKFAWGRNFANRKDRERFDYFPKTRKERKAFMNNAFFNFLIIPNFFYSSMIFLKYKDPVAFLMPFLAFTNTLAYGLSFIKERI